MSWKQKAVKLIGAASCICLSWLFVECDLIQMKNSKGSNQRGKVLARVNDTYLYQDELEGMIAQGTTPSDSVLRVEGYIDSWIRKQLLIQEASQKMDINEADVERKVLDYRFSIIAYEYQELYIKQRLDTSISDEEIENYYRENIDNFILKQNIVQANYLKVPKTAPRTGRIREWMRSSQEKNLQELKSYCLAYSAAYHLTDSAWIVFDELVKGSPLVEIPNKIQFLKSHPYYETSDDNYLYFLKILQYRISDNTSPLEFVRDDIETILLNRRKVELAKRLEEEVYNRALEDNRIEVYRNENE